MTEIVLFTVIIVQAVMHYIERRDLYSRLMSKNLSEYKSGSTSHQKHVSSAHDKVLERWRSGAGDE